MSRTTHVGPALSSSCRPIRTGSSWTRGAPTSTSVTCSAATSSGICRSAAGARSIRDATGLVNALISGWQINGILDASSGNPLSVFSGFHTSTFYDSGTRVATTSANGVTNRADFSGSPGIGEVRRTDRGVEFFTAEERAMFTTPEAGQTGSERNLFTGPGYFQLDLGIFKSFSFGQPAVRVQDGDLQRAEHRQLRRPEHSGDGRRLRHDHRYARSTADRAVRAEVLLLMREPSGCRSPSLVVRGSKSQ